MLQTDRRNPQGVPTVVQKRHITNMGSQLTSFGLKNVTSPTQGPNRPFRCLDKSQDKKNDMMD